MESVFVISWDNQGLESILPITEIEKQQAWDILANKPHGPENVNREINFLEMRARMNPQRHYEIYAITAVEGITKEDIEEMFKNAPQEAANTMRRIGEKIYSDRADASRVKIT